MSRTHPFEKLLVIDFTHVLAGPACAYYLGLLGAEVIKVESLDRGDAIRHRGGTDREAAEEGMSTSYLTQAAGKKSIALDLEAPDGLAMFHSLLSRADVLVENHIPTTMKRLGLDERTLEERHPHLIHCAMTGYGRGGPQENTAAYDVNIQAACGLMDATGTTESGPIRTGAPILDYSTALAASFAISAALVERARTGRGNFIDVSMLETGFSLMSSTVTDFLKTGNAPQRRGNLANSRSPGAGSFPCQSGVMSLGVNEEAHFRNLASALGRDDWLSDPRFGKRESRKANADALAKEIEEELSKKTAQEWEPLLQDAGVPAARLRGLQDALESEHVQKRSYVQTLEDGLSIPTLPFRLGGAKAYAPTSVPPRHGADTETIRNWIGRTSDPDRNEISEAAVEAALAVMTAHIDALNAHDEAALAETLHFPQYRLAGANLKVWETSRRYFDDFRARAGDDWVRSEFQNVDILRASASKVHLEAKVVRFNAKDEEISSFPSLWVITHENGRWAAKFRSSHAES